MIFEVEDAERCFRLLEERGGTPITDLQVHEDEGGTLRTFNITTPLGDTTFRFVERRGYRGLYPGVARHPAPLGGKNAFGFGHVDHLTSNFQTMKPALLWMEHVLGMEEFWEVHFHTKDAAEAKRAALEAARLRAPLRRDEGPRVRREVREQRAVAPGVQVLADQRVQRGAPRRRHPARGAHRDGHPPGGARHADAASSSCRRPRRTTRRSPTGSSAPASAGSTRT